MVIQSNCKFIENAEAPIVSKTFFNTVGGILALQVDGAKGAYFIEGRNASTGDWYPLAAINLSDFSVKREGIDEPGVYEIGIISIRELRARVESTRGRVSIVGQIISAEET